MGRSLRPEHLAFFRSRMNEHNLVSSYASLDNGDEYLYLITRARGLPAVRVHLSDAYEYTRAEFLARPNEVTQRNSFVILGLPHAHDPGDALIAVEVPGTVAHLILCDQQCSVPALYLFYRGDSVVALPLPRGRTLARLDTGREAIALAGGGPGLWPAPPLGRGWPPARVPCQAGRPGAGPGVRRGGWPGRRRRPRPGAVARYGASAAHGCTSAPRRQ